MVALAHPATDLIFRGGRFNRADASLTAIFFAIFSVSLAFWAAQAIYARAFYAAGNTLTPMLASTIVTVLSLPVYWFLFHLHGARGLAIASDLGILLQTGTLAVLLHRRKMVSLRGLEFAELARSLFAALVSAGALYGLARFVTSNFFAAHFVSPAGGFHLTANGIAAAFSSSAAPASAAVTSSAASAVASGLSISGTLSTDLISLTIGTILWFFLCYLTLRLTGSQLPAQLSARLRRPTA
jgi:peptidoglycan biosynthesis protein MviN/MurJ (putative lipid II flippase)